MNEPAANGINLPVMEHHLASAHAFNINREDSVVACVRAQYRREVFYLAHSRHGIPFAAVDGHWDKTLCACATRVVLATALACPCANRYLFSFCHRFSRLSAFSNQPPTLFALICKGG